MSGDATGAGDPPTPPVPTVEHATSGSSLRVPDEAELPGNQVTAFRHVRYPLRPRRASMPPELDLPNTPPLDGLKALEASTSRAQVEAKVLGPPNLVREPSVAEERPRRLLAASVIRRCVRCYLARRARAKLASAVSRPAQVRVVGVTNLELLCDFRDVISVYCNIRILKKPYGPFMFQFTSSKCTHVNLPTWKDEFFVPAISSRCELVVTLVGLSTSNRLRFLGQAVAPLDTGWESQTSEITAPLKKWTFPVDETLIGLHRFVQGNVNCVVTPVASRNMSLSGQFQMTPVVSAQRSNSIFGWTRRMSNPVPVASPLSSAPPETPTAMRKEMVPKWGVLTDTHLHLFDHSTAKLSASLELSKLQLIKSSPLAKGAKARREPGRLYPLKVYCNGTMYAFFVTTYAQQLAWEYKIDLHRRQLMIP